MTTPPANLFERIQTLARCGPQPVVQERLFGAFRTGGTELRYDWQPTVEECIRWLDSTDLTMRAGSYRHEMAGQLVSPFGTDAGVALSLPSHRAQRRGKADLDALRRKYNETKAAEHYSEAELEQIWRELKKPELAIRVLDVDRLPADALGFYRPFHFAPHDEWGIYLLLDPLLNYCNRLHETFRPHLKGFNRETLMGCILFEVFHHEFFHHMVECAATTIEIISAAFGPPHPVLRNYWEYRFSNAPGLGAHKHHPLEEALANAYAFNSFSFLSRMQVGYKLVWVKLYQEVLKKCWPQEPEGYRYAGEYINDRYVSGATQLMAMLLESADLDPAALMLVSKAVMPTGNSAFLAKPDVPTYLVGSDSVLAAFAQLVPAPNETYTSLLWLGDVAVVDEFLKRKRLEEKERRTLGARQPSTS